MKTQYVDRFMLKKASIYFKVFLMKIFLFLFIFFPLMPVLLILCTHNKPAKDFKNTVNIFQYV